MKTTNLLIRCLAAAVLFAAADGQGQSTASTEEGETAEAKFVLLSDGRVVNGVISKERNGYVLRKGTALGLYQEDRVVYIADTLDKIYDYKRKNIPDHDLAEHYKLSQWCQTQGLRDKAVEELEHILEIDPSNSFAASRLKLMRRGSRSDAPDVLKPATVRPVSAPFDANKVITTFHAGYGKENFQRFASIEKILNNKCSRCHSSARYEGEFKLYIRHHGRGYDQRVTARNLDSVMNQVNLTEPQRSPLLYKALQKHGGMTVTALGGINDDLYLALAEFVDGVATWYAGSPDQVVETSKPKPPAEGEFGGKRVMANDVLTARPVRPDTRVKPLPPPGFGPVTADDAPPATFGKSKPSKPRDVEDPFDPADFNRQADKAADATSESP